MEEGNRPPLPPLSESSKPNPISMGGHPQNNNNVPDQQTMETMQTAIWMAQAAQTWNAFALRQHEMYRRIQTIFGNAVFLPHNASSVNSGGQDGMEESIEGGVNALNGSSCNTNHTIEEVLTRIQGLQDQMILLFHEWRNETRSVSDHPQPKSIPDRPLEFGGPRLPTCPSKLLAPPPKKTIYLPNPPAAHRKSRGITSNNDDKPPVKRAKKDDSPKGRQKKETRCSKEAMKSTSALPANSVFTTESSSTSTFPSKRTLDNRKEPTASTSRQPGLHRQSNTQQAVPRTLDREKLVQIQAVHVFKPGDLPVAKERPIRPTQRMHQPAVHQSRAEIPQPIILVVPSKLHGFTLNMSPNLEETLKTPRTKKDDPKETTSRSSKKPAEFTSVSSATPVVFTTDMSSPSRFPSKETPNVEKKNINQKSPWASISWQPLNLFNSIQEADARTFDNGKSTKIRIAHVAKLSDQSQPPKMPTHPTQKTPQLSIQRADDSALLLSSKQKTSKETTNLEKTLKTQKEAIPSTSWQTPHSSGSQEATVPTGKLIGTVPTEKIRPDDFKPKRQIPEKTGLSAFPPKVETSITEKSPNLVKTVVQQEEVTPSTSTLHQAPSRKLDVTNSLNISPVKEDEPKSETNNIMKKCEVCGSTALLQNWYCQGCISNYTRNVRAFESDFPINQCTHSGEMAGVCAGCQLGKFVALYKFHNPQTQIPLFGMIPRIFYERYRNGISVTTPQDFSRD